jgi:hypothetical protein
LKSRWNPSSVACSFFVQPNLRSHPSHMSEPYPKTSTASPPSLLQNDVSTPATTKTVRLGIVILRTGGLRLVARAPPRTRDIQISWH